MISILAIPSLQGQRLRVDTFIQAISQLCNPTVLLQSWIEAKILSYPEEKWILFYFLYKKRNKVADYLVTECIVRCYRTRCVLLFHADTNIHTFDRTCLPSSYTGSKCCGSQTFQMGWATHGVRRLAPRTRLEMEEATCRIRARLEGACKEEVARFCLSWMGSSCSRTTREFCLHRFFGVVLKEV